MAVDWVKRMGVLALVFLLSSCYIPDKFRSELRLSRYGDWALTYEGDLLHVPILHDYAQDKIKPENEDTRQENIRRDLVRDSAFSKVELRGKGRFRVKYERTGHLGEVQLTALIRRDSRILSLKSDKNGMIFVVANGVKAGDAQRMSSMGIGMQGEFRITTDGNVIDHNANEVRAMGPYKVYVWRIENALSATPKLAMARTPAPEKPAQ